MGRTTTPTFRLEVLESTNTGRNYAFQSAWPTRHAGRPTDATLAAHVQVHEASTRPGGVNEHLGASTVTRARVIRQSTGDVVAEYHAPMFAVLAA